MEEGRTHVTSCNWKFRGEEEEDCGYDDVCQSDLKPILAPARLKTGVDLALTILATHPTGPGSTNGLGPNIFLPLIQLIAIGIP